jgi:hypothetical protein
MKNEMCFENSLSYKTRQVKDPMAPCVRTYHTALLDSCDQQVMADLIEIVLLLIGCLPLLFKSFIVL